MAPIVISPLAQICKSVGQYLDGALGGGAKVTIGNPADAVPDANGKHHVNLFFFRFEPYSFDADGGPQDVWFVRMHCLITPFSLLEDNVATGDTDLRLVGEVLRVFGEKPVFKIAVQGEPYHVQVIFQNLGLDQLNQLWATQGEVIYRPSLLYEMSLAPVIPSVKRVEAPLTGALIAGARADRAATAPEGAPPARPLPVMSVPTQREDWAPGVMFVTGGSAAQFLSFAVGSPELAAFNPRVWIAGEVGASVELRWDVWDAQRGWRTDPARTPAVATTRVIDPELAADAVTTPAPLPFDDHAGQAVLYATRSYRRASDGVALSVRSNPLLVNLYEASP